MSENRPGYPASRHGNETRKQGRRQHGSATQDSQERGVDTKEPTGTTPPRYASNRPGPRTQTPPMVGTSTNYLVAASGTRRCNAYLATACMLPALRKLKSGQSVPTEYPRRVFQFGVEKRLFIHRACKVFGGMGNSLLPLG